MQDVDVETDGKSIGLQIVIQYICIFDIKIMYDAFMGGDSVMERLIIVGRNIIKIAQKDAEEGCVEDTVGKGLLWIMAAAPVTDNVVGKCVSPNGLEVWMNVWMTVLEDNPIMSGNLVVAVIEYLQLITMG